jgi:hypothetical protein
VENAVTGSARKVAAWLWVGTFYVFLLYQTFFG